MKTAQRAAAVCLALVAACAGGPSPGTRVLPVEHDSLVTLAPRYKDHACHDTFSRGGRDPEACGPFPCENDKCHVEPCTSPKDCYHGICEDGYCLNVRAQGEKACAPYADPPRAGGSSDESSPVAKAYYASRMGCACAARSEKASDDYEACAEFPCTLRGCYVQACQGDSDCKFGLCSGHASGPHGYCVTHDDY